MNGTAMLMAIQILQALPALIKAGVDITALVEDQAAKLKKMDEEQRDPTAEEWDDMNRIIDGLRGHLHGG